MISLSSDHLVIDAGIGWRLFTPHPDRTLLEQQLSLQKSAGVRLAAPTLWQYEVTSILAKGLYFKQLTTDEVETALRLSSNFDIALVPPDATLVTAAMTWTTRLKRAAAYNSFYLALARRLDCELWTTDRQLVNAVGAPWVRHLGSAAQEHPA
jgi:predicted nucleic acid-binding protein